MVAGQPPPQNIDRGTVVRLDLDPHTEVVGLTPPGPDAGCIGGMETLPNFARYETAMTDAVGIIGNVRGRDHDDVGASEVFHCAPLSIGGWAIQRFLGRLRGNPLRRFPIFDSGEGCRSGALGYHALSTRHSSCNFLPW